MKLKPRNWEKFQHYKNRCPPWIKVHRPMLDDRDFMRLPLASIGLAELLWLLASEHRDGIFDADIDELVFRLRKPERDIQDALNPLLEKGFFEVVEGDASTMLATCLQHATPETEYSETEGEAKANAGEQKPKKPKAAAFDPFSFPLDPDANIDPEMWAAFVEMRITKKAPLTQRACELAVAKLKTFEAHGKDMANEALSKAVFRNYTGLFMPDKQDTSYRDMNAPKQMAALWAGLNG